MLNNIRATDFLKLFGLYKSENLENCYTSFIFAQNNMRD